MKKFNLKAAKKGKPVKTLKNLDVRILCYDYLQLFSGSVEKMILGTLQKDNFEITGIWDKNGVNIENSNLNLKMKSEKKKKAWINLYKKVSIKETSSEATIYTEYNDVFLSKKKAISNIDENQILVKTIKIKW